MTPPFPRFHAVGDIGETTAANMLAAMMMAALAGAVVGSLITVLIMRVAG